MSKKLKSFIGWGLASPFIVVIVGVLLMALLQIIAMTFIMLTLPFSQGEKTREYSHQFEILALEDNQAHIVSRYSVDTQQRYYFTRRLDGGIKVGWAETSKSIIIEDDNEQPRIEVYKTYPKYAKWATKLGFENIFIDMNVKNRYYKIYIPKGSITEEFNVDLK